MRPIKLKLLLLSCLLFLSSGTVIAQENCSRECLEDILDHYLEAIISNTPETAPLAIGIRQTENAINVAPGYGTWLTVTALGEAQRRYFDPVSGQAAYYGSLKEGNEDALATIRIKVDARKITEAEWIIARPEDRGLSGRSREPGERPANLLNVEYLKLNGPPERIVPLSERTDRDTLIRIVDSYFDALNAHDRTVALAHAGCGRAENGSPAPGGQFLPPIDGSPIDPDARDCLFGLEGFNLQMVAARRIPLIDVEAQAVLSYAVFIRKPGTTTPRNVFSEWFFIDQAKIRTVYTAMFYPEAELAVPNWPPYTGNWPLAAEIVPENANR